MNRADQRMAALAKANGIRTAKAILKREMKARRITPAMALADPRAAQCKLDEFLLAIPKIGRRKAGQLLGRDLRLSPSKRVGSLSERQLELLRRALEGRA